MSPQVRSPVVAADDKQAFQLMFQRSLRRCVERGFSAEECFGIIWEETLEKIDLSDAEERALFSEMIHWARTRLIPWGN